MKKVLFAISVVALALVSCTEFEPETPVTYEKTVAPTLTVTVTGDNSIAVEVLPGSNTGYYAYAIVAGEVDPATVDPATLIAGKLSGSIAKEVANAAKKDTLKIEATKLTPNAKYTAVAVAAGKETQAFSQVVGETVLTTDTTAPSLNVSKYDYEVEEDAMTFYVPFDDPITLTDKPVFVATVFALNYAKSGVLQPLSQVQVPADSAMVAVDNKTIIVSIPKELYVPGAFVGLQIGAGSVKNALDSLNAAYTTLEIKNSSSGISTKGMVSRYDIVNFDLESPVAEDSVVKFQDPATLAIELAPKLYGKVNLLYGKGEGNVTVTAVNAVTGRKVEYTLGNWDVNATYDGVILGLDEQPDFGYYSSYAVAEGAVEDLYGNVNNALTIEDQVFCSYGYALTDILGTYSGTVTGYRAGAAAEAKVVVAPSDDKDYDVVIYDLFKSFSTVGLTSYTPLDYTSFYGVFDPDAGVIVLDGDAIAEATLSAYSFDGYVVTWNEAGEVVFNVPKAGQLVLGGELDVDLYKLGTWDYIIDAQYARTATSYEFTKPSSAPAKKAAKKDLKKDNAARKFVK